MKKLILASVLVLASIAGATLTSLPNGLKIGTEVRYEMVTANATVPTANMWIEVTLNDGTTANMLIYKP